MENSQSFIVSLIVLYLILRESESHYVTSILITQFSNSTPLISVKRQFFMGLSFLEKGTTEDEMAGWYH